MNKDLVDSILGKVKKTKGDLLQEQSDHVATKQVVEDKMKEILGLRTDVNDMGLTINKHEKSTLTFVDGYLQTFEERDTAFSNILNN